MYKQRSATDFLIIYYFFINCNCSDQSRVHTKIQDIKQDINLKNTGHFTEHFVRVTPLPLDLHPKGGSGGNTSGNFF